jgi:IclR family transcriptional regulator, pca regulon regulatory protein
MPGEIRPSAPDGPHPIDPKDPIEGLARGLSVACAQGYSILREQLDTGLQGVAMVLRDRRGVAIAALGMTLHVESWPRDRIVAQLVPAMSETAQSLRPML